jgi:hypothetical protein
MFRMNGIARCHGRDRDVTYQNNAWSNCRMARSGTPPQCMIQFFHYPVRTLTSVPRFLGMAREPITPIQNQDLR